MAVVTFGSEYVFESATTTYVANVRLSDTTFVVVYIGSSGLEARVGTISGTTITYGTSKTVDSSTTSTYVDVVAINETNFIVAWNDAAVNGTVVICSISGTTITVNTPVIFQSGNTQNISVALLSSTSFVISYCSPSVTGRSHCVVCTISGTTITVAGSNYPYADQTSISKVIALSSTTIAVIYYDNNASFLRGVAGSISGTTVTYGTPVELEVLSISLVKIDAIKVDSSTFVALWARNTTVGVASVVSISGTDLTVNTLYTFNSGGTYYLSGALIDSGNFIVAFKDGGNSSYGKALTASITGVDIAFDTEYTFNAATTNYIDIGKQSNGVYSIVYQDNGNSSWGTAIIGTIPINKKINNVSYSKWNNITIVKYNSI